jgi:hypothetical protein
VLITRWVPLFGFDLSSKRLDLLLDIFLSLGLGFLALAVLLALRLPLLLSLLLSFVLVLLEGIFPNGFVSLKVEILQVSGINLVVNVFRELRLVALLVVIGETFHVFGDVAAQDILAESLSVELFSFDIETGESVLRVRDEKATIRGTLHGAEDTSTGGSTGKTDIEEDLERTAGAFIGLSGLGESVFTISFLYTLEVLIEIKLLECTASEKETSSVGGSPVGEAVVNTVALQFVGVGAGKDLVARDLGVNNLGDDVTVGETNDQAVFGSIVLVLGLGDEALPGVVIGLSLPAALVLGLVATVNRESVR